MPCWYYEKKELKNSPSFRDGIDPATEARYRREGARFILDAGSKLGLRYDTCATGVVYFHRFYMFHSFKDFHRYVMGACCLFLAGKSEETPKKAKDIIRTCQQLISPQLFVIFGEDPREEIITMERILLQTIKFDLKVDHPYAFMLRLAKKLRGDKDRIQKMAQMAWTFINDSLCTTLCLQWEAEIISVSLMYLASRLTKFDVLDWESRPHGCKLKWWEFFLEGLSMELMEDICHQVLDLYSNKDSKQEESPPISPAARQQNQQRQISQHTNSPQPPSASNKRSRPITPSDAASAQYQQQQPDSKRQRRSQPPLPDQRSNGADKQQQQRRPPTTELPPPPPPPPQPSVSSHPRHLPPPLPRSNSSSSSVGNNIATTTTCPTSDFSTQNPYVASGMFSASFMNKEGTQSIQSLISQSGKQPATHGQYPPGYSSVTTAPPLPPPHPYSQPPPYHPPTNYPPPPSAYTTTTGYHPPSMPPPPPVQAPPPPGGFAPHYNYPPPPPFPPTSQPPPGFPTYPPLPPGNMPPPPLPTSSYPPPPPMYPPPPPGNYPPPPSQPPCPGVHHLSQGGHRRRPTPL